MPRCLVASRSHEALGFSRVGVTRGDPRVKYEDPLNPPDVVKCALRLRNLGVAEVSEASEASDQFDSP